MYRGTAYADGGDLDRAIADFDQAIAVDPNFAGAFFNRGLVYIQKGDLERAVADFSQVIGLDPGHAGAHALRGMVYARVGEREKAISDLERSLELGLEPDARQRAQSLLEELRR
jgi:tetratricopeptide (TPR) repeat protein